MRSIYTEVLIKANYKQVWSVLTDFKSYSDWNPFILKIKGNPQLDARLAVTIKSGNQSTMNFRPKIILLKENEELRWLGHVLIPGIFDGEHSFLLKSLSSDETLFIQRENFSGILSAPVFYKISESTRAGFSEINQALKA